jgi:glycosyltransferase involved in cell wall biosynthesis
MKLSVAIITYNEERNIERCLRSVCDWADEIVVVDSFSKDRTQAICESYGARFMTHPFEGHIQQKNYALTQCKGDWILSLDADEAPDVFSTEKLILRKVFDQLLQEIAKVSDIALLSSPSQ